MGDETEQQGEQRSQQDGEKVTGRKLERLREKQRGRCYYSGEELTLENVCVDHMLPISRGGEHSMQNVVLCTQQVNKMKGTMTDSEFVTLCMKVAAYVPPGDPEQQRPAGGAAGVKVLRLDQSRLR